MNPNQHSSFGAPDSAETEPSPAGEGDSTVVSDRRSSAPARARNKTLSQILTDIAADPVRDAVAINDLITLLGGRGRAGLILLFAVPNVLPAPPGMSGVLGLPLLYLSFQMMLGRLPWLPRLRKKSNQLGIP